LQFLACSFYCRVFVDGEEIGEHRAGGYSPWWIDVPAPQSSSSGAARELFVLADNRFNPTTAPLHTHGDFWSYGGLMRSVILHDLPDQPGQAWPWRAYVIPTGGGNKVDINITLTDLQFSGALDYALVFDNASVGVRGQVNATNGVAVLPGMEVPSPRLWSLESPHLHLVTVTVGNASITERFGLRLWGVDSASSRITLNGKIVKLHGFNHHTQWPVLDSSGGAVGRSIGASPTDAQLDTDISLLKEAGANFIRGSHYPQDQRWLDRLDEVGIVMW
jgi:beta-glucuronidase